jgi:hypothetical protein
MNLIDFTKNGGYRFKQFTLRKMQEAYFQLLKMFVSFCNIPETGNYIISGCKVVGVNITDGYLYIDGELCKFTQAEGTAASKIKKNVVIQSLGFKNGNNENVFRFVDAVIDPAGTTLSAFTRIAPVFDANYNNYSTEEKDKLNGIEAGAEVNVQSDWSQTNAAADDFIKNKPLGKLLTYLKQGVYIHGDLLSSSQLVTIAFGDVGTDQYKVLGNIIGSGSNGTNESRVNYIIRNKTATSFQLAMNDYTNSGNQNLRFEYVLIPDDNS